MIHSLLSLLVDIVALMLRAIVEFGGYPVPVGNQIYLLPLLTLPLAALRQAKRRRWALAFVLLLITLYLTYTRLTTFRDAAVTIGGMTGNFAYWGLGAMFGVPLRWWLKPSREERYG